MDHSSRKRVVRFGASMSILLILSILSLSIVAKEVGIWVESGSTGSCTGSNICADWEVDGEPTLSCCIEPRYLGTSDFEACAAVR